FPLTVTDVSPPMTRAIGGLSVKGLGTASVVIADRNRPASFASPWSLVVKMSGRKPFRLKASADARQAVLFPPTITLKTLRKTWDPGFGVSPIFPRTPLAIIV